MSVFKKRRKIIRQKQEADRKRWEENSKKMGKSMQNVIKAAEIIDKEHPEFESLNKEERAKLFGKIYNDLTK